MLAKPARLGLMTQNVSSLGGYARAKVLSGSDRSRIAKKAAKARWAASGKGILSRREIRMQVSNMLDDREAVAYLFGSYARGEARPSSDVDIMVVEKKIPTSRLYEIHTLRKRLKLDKDIDLIVIDEENFETWKNSQGTLQHEVYKEGVRLV
jgi:predicted nucleotidyltransferase